MRKKQKIIISGKTQHMHIEKKQRAKFQKDQSQPRWRCCHKVPTPYTYTFAVLEFEKKV